MHKNKNCDGVLTKDEIRQHGHGKCGEKHNQNHTDT